MNQVYFLQTTILRHFNQIASQSVRESLICFLEEVVDTCDDTRAGVIAETLLANVNKYRFPRCSEKQALAVAYGAYENCITL